MRYLLLSMRRFLVAAACLLGAGPAAAATINTTHARDLDPAHYSYVYLNDQRGVGHGAYLSFWTRDNWRTAMFRLGFPKTAPPTRLSFGDTQIWVGDQNVKIRPLRLKFSTLVYNGNPWNPLWLPVPRDAWLAIPDLTFELSFFGGELRHLARLTLGDRSATRYDFAFGDVPARAGFITDDAPAATPLSALSQPVGFGAPAPVPLPATGLLVLTALAAVALARRGAARA